MLEGHPVITHGSFDDFLVVAKVWYMHQCVTDKLDKNQCEALR